ncbi:phospholipase D-like domain-containing protein [Sulfitobacter pacificus]
MLPKKGDHLITWLAAFAYFDELREAGVEIWLFDDGFLHQKVILVDERISSIGTINLDNRSCRLNFEATAVIFDKEAAQATAKMLEADFEVSALLEKSLPEQPYHVRFGAPIARLFAPLL